MVLTEDRMQYPLAGSKPVWYSCTGEAPELEGCWAMVENVA